MQRVGVYTRVSTDEQAETGHSLEAQLDAMRQYCSAKGFVIEEVYEERGKSGKTAKRPEFQRLLADVDSGRIDIVMVHKLDRFSRSLVDTMNYLNDFHNRKIGFVSLSEDFDFASAIGKVILAVLAAFAQLYLDNLSQETKKGKKQRVAKGWHNGTLSFGYTTSAILLRRLDTERAKPEPANALIRLLDGALGAAAGKAATEAVPDPLTAAGVRLAFTLYATGQYSYHDVAVAMNRAGYKTTGTHGARPFTKDTVVWLLKNRFYLGEVSYGYRTDDPKRVWKQGTHEPLIDEVLFQSVEYEIKARRRLSLNKSTAQSSSFLLSHLVYCADCQTRMRGNTQRGVRVYLDKAREYHVECSSTTATHHAEPLEVQVGDWVTNIQIPEGWLEEVAGSNGQSTASEVAVVLKTRLDRLNHIYMMGNLPEADYVREQETIKGELEKINEAPTGPSQRTHLEKVYVLIKDLPKLWAQANQEQKRRWIQFLVQRLYVRSGKLVAVQPTPLAWALLNPEVQMYAYGGPDGI